MSSRPQNPNRKDPHNDQTADERAIDAELETGLDDVPTEVVAELQIEGRRLKAEIKNAKDIRHPGHGDGKREARHLRNRILVKARIARRRPDLSAQEVAAEADAYLEDLYAREEH